MKTTLLAASALAFASATPFPLSGSIFAPHMQACEINVQDLNTTGLACDDALQGTKEFQCIGFAQELAGGLDFDMSNWEQEVQKLMDAVPELPELDQAGTVRLLETIIDTSKNELHALINDHIVLFAFSKIGCVVDASLQESIDPLVSILVGLSPDELAKQLKGLIVPLLTALDVSSRRLLASEVTTTFRQLMEEAAITIPFNLGSRACTGATNDITDVKKLTGLNLVQLNALFSASGNITECHLCEPNPAAAQNYDGVKIEEILMKGFNEAMAKGGDLEELGEKMVNLLSALFDSFLTFNKDNEDAVKEICTGMAQQMEGTMGGLTEEQMKMGKECIEQVAKSDGLLMAALYNYEKYPDACKNVNELVCDMADSTEVQPFPIFADIYEDDVVSTFFGHDYLSFFNSFESAPAKLKAVCDSKLAMQDNDSGASIASLSAAGLIAAAVAALRV